MQFPKPQLTTLLRLVQNLTAQDTHFSPISTKHSRTLPSHGNPLSLISQYKYKWLFLSLVLNKLIQKLNTALSWEQLYFKYSFPKAKRNNTGFCNLIVLYSWKQAIHWCIFLQFRLHLLSEIPSLGFKFHLLFGSKTKKMLKISSLVH